MTRPRIKIAWEISQVRRKLSDYMNKLMDLTQELDIRDSRPDVLGTPQSRCTCYYEQGVRYENNKCRLHGLIKTL